MKRWISTEIDIDAPPAVVWKVLTDLSGYCSWNPTIRRIEGNLAVESCLRVFACLPCGLPMMFRPRLLEFKPEREIKWIGNLVVPGLIDGEHLFLINPIDDFRTRFVQREEYHGILLPLLWKWLRDQGRRAFEMMNQALKAEAERCHDWSL
jgi:hypothetical protein